MPHGDDLDVSAAQAGDADALVRLVARYEPSLSTHLHRFTNNDVILQDLRQETYLELCRSLASYRHEGPFARWLRQIASRVGYRYWAGQAKEVRAKTAYLELCRTACSEAQRGVRSDSVDDLLAHLGRYDRSLLEMKYIQGLTAIEIAERLGWNAGRVRVRLHRACRRLRNQLGMDSLPGTER